MRATVLKPFPYFADGIRIRELAAGSVEEIRDALVPGLVAQGYLHADAPPAPEVPEPAPPAPAVPSTGAPIQPEEPADANGNGIPDDWEKLNWFSLAKLVEQRTGAKPKNKAEAIATMKAIAGQAG